MLAVDEYLAVRVLVGAPPRELDLDETLALPAYRHYRLLQRIHTPGSGQLSRLLSDADQQAMRRPHPEVLQILDPRPLLAAGLVHGRRLWFGTPRNVGRRLEATGCQPMPSRS